MSAPSFETSSTPSTARPSPTTPPARPSATLSISKLETRRPRVSPNAARTAISWRRPSARTRKRFATLAQPIRKMSPTAPSRIHSAGAMSPTTSSRRSRSTALKPGIGQDRRRRVAGEGRRQIAEELVELGLRRGEVDTRLQPPETVHAEHAEWRDRRVDLHLDPDLGLGSRIGEPFGHDADDFSRDAVDQHGAPDDGGVGAEAPLPESMTEDRDRRGARKLLLAPQRATE